ncbi:hypothetical protein AMTRI_Chr11g96600 [Amborella trichopoda]
MFSLCLPSLFLISLPALFCSLYVSLSTSSHIMSLYVSHSLSIYMVFLGLPLGFPPPSLFRFHGILCITFLKFCTVCVWMEIQRRMV